MKILHLLASNSYSGAEKVAIDICNAFKDDFEFYYCSPQGDIADVLRDNAIPYFSLDQLDKASLQAVIDEIQPDIIHCHDLRASLLGAKFTGVTRHWIATVPTTPRNDGGDSSSLRGATSEANVRRGNLADKSNIRIISHLHNFYTLKNPFINPLAWLYRSVVSKFDRIILLSTTVYDQFTRSLMFRHFSAKAIALHNYSDKQELLKLASQTPKFSTSDLVFVGRIIKIKRPQLFIEVVDKLKSQSVDISAKIVGQGELEAEVEGEITKRELENNIEMLGFQSNPYPYIQNADFLVITSKNEGGPIVAIEAIMLGTVVLTLEFPGIASRIGGNFVFKSVDELCVKYSELKSDPNAYADALKQQTENISKLVTWKDGLKGVYDDEE